MKFAWLLLSFFCVQDQVPFKPKDQFEIKLDFKFKQRPQNPISSTLVDMDGDARKHPSTSDLLLPYLYLNVVVLKLDDLEQKVRVADNKGITMLNKKAESGMIAKLDLGFTDDIKDRVSSHEFVVSFLTKDKKHLSRIVIFFDEDGTYIVNGEKRGKL
jgi:hypothetical protein